MPIQDCCRFFSYQIACERCCFYIVWCVVLCDLRHFLCACSLVSFSVVDSPHHASYSSTSRCFQRGSGCEGLPRARLGVSGVGSGRLMLPLPPSPSRLGLLSVRSRCSAASDAPYHSWLRPQHCHLNPSRSLTGPSSVVQTSVCVCVLAHTYLYI